MYVCVSGFARSSRNHRSKQPKQAIADGFASCKLQFCQPFLADIWFHTCSISFLVTKLPKSIVSRKRPFGNRHLPLADSAQQELLPLPCIVDCLQQACMYACRRSRQMLSTCTLRRTRVSTKNATERATKTCASGAVSDYLTCRPDFGATMYASYRERERERERKKR